MKRATIFVTFLLLASAVAQAQATDPLKSAASDALSDDQAKAVHAIQTLRSAGYAGLNALLNATAEKANETRVRAVVDAVAMQKDATESRLYWFTDLTRAETEAARTGKPILTLRMLGNLNEDLSCANSRFFRTTLYPNKEISAYLREHFILHWQSVRPVPIVTIDMGDGRKLMRTLTGNSIHYILDSQGRVIDGLPGLYGPAAFLRSLRAAETEALATAPMDPTQFAIEMRAWHTQRADDLRDAFASDLQKVGGAGIPDDAAWRKIAQLHQDDGDLDAASVELMRTKVPADVAMRVTASKMAVEDPVLRMIRNVQGLIAVDTVKNEYQLHETLHEWLSTFAFPTALKPLNDRVYADLFKTPASDPWLGLAPPDVYSAIDNGGEVTAER